jgi:hypothetical protein
MTKRLGKRHHVSSLATCSIAIALSANRECCSVGSEEWHVTDGGSGGVQTQNGKLCRIAQ